MRHVRSWLQFLTGVTFAAFALAGSAATTKFFYAEFASVVPAGTAVPVTVRIHNTSPPPGLSTINSMQIVAPAGVTITGSSMGTISPAAGAGTVTIANFTGIKRSESRQFTLYVTNTVTTCTSGTWSIDVRTGNAYPGGDAFEPVTANMKLTSVLGCDATLACSSQPFTEGTTTITRDLDNPDKAPTVCQDVGFNLVFSNSDRTVLIYWDESSNPEVVLFSDTNWPIENLTSTQWPKRTQVAWRLDPDSNPPNQPAFIDAPACLSNNQPGVVGMDEVFPKLTNPPSPYENEELARACIYFESVEVQPMNACPSAANGCVKVKTKMWISGDPWLTRQ